MAVSCCAESNRADAEGETVAEVAAPDSALMLTAGNYAEARSDGCRRYSGWGADVAVDVAAVVIATSETVLGSIHLDHSGD